ncbi:hypothetical protein KC686_01165 [Candidatus Woesebacteria bacterium]|nr:hypothetical protein [Candidatus Woesebacteria bacterium]
MLLQVLFDPTGGGLTNSSIEELTRLVFKGMFLVAGVLYVAFAFVVVRQIHIMRSTLITSVSPMLLLIGYIHLVVSIIVLLMFFLLLSF